MRGFMLVLALLLIPGICMGQSAVGDTLSAPADTAAVDCDLLVTATGTVLFSGGRGEIRAVDVACNGTATFYLYAIDSDLVVTKRWGPFYTRSWASLRSPLPPGDRARVLDLTALSATEFIITPRSN